MFKHFFHHVSSLIIVCVLGMTLILLQSAPDQAGESTKGSVDLQTAISRVARQNIPAVVHIEVTERQEAVNPVLPFENDPYFRYFFATPRLLRNTEREIKGMGSGIIIEPNGYILTNNHVVGGATEIQVLLSDGNRYRARLVGTDPKTDLAVIKISAKRPLSAVKFGDSDRVEVGQWVVAIGHPRALDQTVSQGIISAKHRVGIMDPSSYQDCLQTDAAINPGNTGGPLLNLQGDVIGVNAAIVSQSGGFEGIGFAIPSNAALHIAKTLIDHGKVERGWLGINIQSLTPELAKSFGMDTPMGALITGVLEKGPAEKAGLRKGDVVIGYQDKEIHDSSSLRSKVATSPIGQEVKVTILRKCKKQLLRVKIGNLEDSSEILFTSLKYRLGAEVRLVAVKEAKKYNLDPGQGIAIAWLDLEGPLGQVGFEVGDIILEINGQAVKGLEALIDLVNTLGQNQRITLLALDHRSGRTGYVQVKTR